MNEAELIKAQQEQLDNLSKVNGNLVRANDQLNHNLSAYLNLRMTPVEIFKHMEMLCKYKDTGLTPEEIKDILSVLSENQDDVDEDGISMGLIHDLLELARWRQAEEQGLLIKRDCSGCISDDCYECARCGKYEDRYKSEEVLKGGSL